MPGGVIAVDQHRVGMGDFQRARRHRRQHGVEIERGGDRAADFLEHLELVDRLRQIARALLDLGFEAGIGFLQLARHAVELVGEFFQLVLGVHVDAMAEIAGAEPPRAGAQRRDRDQHPPRQQGAGEDRDHEPERDQQARSAPAGRGSAPAPARSAARTARTSRVSAPHSTPSAPHGRRRRCRRSAPRRPASSARRPAAVSQDPCRPRGPWRSSPAPGRAHRPHRRRRPCRPGRRRGNRRGSAGRSRRASRRR